MSLRAGVLKMSTAVKITCDEFEAMIARGDFAVDDPRRYELIDGEIIEMPPPDPRHEEAIDRLNKWSGRNLPIDEVRVRVQGTISLPELDSVPFPDVSWLREADYSTRRPNATDVHLLIEVSNTTLSYDRNTKARLYAAAGIADYWIVNIKGECFEILREPGVRGYGSKTVLYSGEEVRSLAFPELAFPISLIFPE